MGISQNRAVPLIYCQDTIYIYIHNYIILILGAPPKRVSLLAETPKNTQQTRKLSPNAAGAQEDESARELLAAGFSATGDGPALYRLGLRS